MRAKPWSWVPSLYFAEGIPYVVVMGVCLAMYKQLGLSNTQITLYTSWLYVPWVIKPLWSPLVDVYRSKRWWILTMQSVIAIAFAGVAFSLPSPYWLQLSLAFFWLLAFSSATHDIAADGFYMLGLSQQDQATFVGIRSTFYRIATIFGQGVIVMCAQWLEWHLIFVILAALFLLIALWHRFCLPRVESKEATIESPHKSTALLEVVVTFFRKPGIVIALLFMLLYRMPEGLLAKVSALFLLDSVEVGGLGLTNAQYGLVQGTVGVIGLTLGGILGGVLAGRDGLKRWLWWMVCAITLPALLYVLIATCPDLAYALLALPGLSATSYLLPATSLCGFIEQFGYGFGFTAYMLYLLHFSRGQYSTSHYSLCTAFMALSMMLPGLVAGWLQEAVGYSCFFILVCLLCGVTFAVTKAIYKSIE